MTIRTVITAAIAAAALAAPSAASADYYITKARAESFARYDARDRYGDATYYAYCRPQGASRALPGYIYHRWVCGWADDTGCEGQLLIAGSHSGRSYYNSRVTRGQRCPS